MAIFQPSDFQVGRYNSILEKYGRTEDQLIEISHFSERLSELQSMLAMKKLSEWLEYYHNLTKEEKERKPKLLILGDNTLINDRKHQEKYPPEFFENNICLCIDLFRGSLGQDFYAENDRKDAMRKYLQTSIEKSGTLFESYTFLFGDQRFYNIFDLIYFDSGVEFNIFHQLDLYNETLLLLPLLNENGRLRLSGPISRRLPNTPHSKLHITQLLQRLKLTKKIKNIYNHNIFDFLKNLFEPESSLILSMEYEREFISSLNEKIQTDFEQITGLENSIPPFQDSYFYVRNSCHEDVNHQSWLCVFLTKKLLTIPEFVIYFEEVLRN